jgi:hypothetical protein
MPASANRIARPNAATASSPLMMPCVRRSLPLPPGSTMLWTPVFPPGAMMPTRKTTKKTAAPATPIPCSKGRRKITGPLGSDRLLTERHSPLNVPPPGTGVYSSAAGSSYSRFGDPVSDIRARLPSPARSLRSTSWDRRRSGSAEDGRAGSDLEVATSAGGICCALVVVREGVLRRLQHDHAADLCTTVTRVPTNTISRRSGILRSPTDGVREASS